MTVESLGNYRAAEAAVAEAEARKMLRRSQTTEFTLIESFPSIEDLKDWLYDLDDDAPMAQTDKLIEDVERAQQVPALGSEIVAEVPFVLSVLVKDSG